VHTGLLSAAQIIRDGCSLKYFKAHPVSNHPELIFWHNIHFLFVILCWIPTPFFFLS